MKQIVKVIILCVFLIGVVNTAFAAANFEDRVSIFGNINIDKPLSGSAVAIFGSVDTKYPVSGDVVAVFGNVNVQSSVAGDVVSVFGRVALGKEAVVNGDVVAIGPGGINRSLGSKVHGDSVGINFGTVDLPNFRMQLPPRINTGLGLFGFLGNIGFVIITLFGLLTISFSGERVRRMSECIEQNIIRKVIIGIVICFCFPIIAILLALTIIGLPIAVIFLGIAFILGFSSLCVYIGRKILELLNSDTNIYGEFIIGAIIFAITISTIHFAGWIGIALTILSIGISFDTGFGKNAGRMNN
jgi:hypothetical protein